MKKLIFGFISVSLIMGLCWYVFQRVDDGYIAKFAVSEEGSNLLVIELDEEQTAGKTKKELNRLLKVKSSQAAGTYYEIPWINNLLHTEFEKGDKVKIFWRGTVMESAPGKVDGTNLIFNFGK